MRWRDALAMQVHDRTIPKRGQQPGPSASLHPCRVQPTALHSRSHLRPSVGRPPKAAEAHAVPRPSNTPKLLPSCPAIAVLPRLAPVLRRMRYTSGASARSYNGWYAALPSAAPRATSTQPASCRRHGAIASRVTAYPALPIPRCIVARVRLVRGASQHRGMIAVLAVCTPRTRSQPDPSAHNSAMTSRLNLTDVSSRGWQPCCTTPK